MDITINEDYMLTILKALYGEFISAKQYFENHKNSRDKIGLISPKEYKEVYNNLLKQSHEQGELLELNLIDS
ncbi:hypothetical protein LGL55_18595 [Clostridium tagluense]|uniref:hypothetical protein n=1 Tax=Clostridium tagluense TaxID=360422 RepID=UPI001C0B0455|nr:hypothetical protein [Clostridium tagluense]MBU3130434.1 hypothetical protein [Clostridium tagluense]MCB2313217.1 hypothetical protein [Clostridium tagluense]MCB2318032.1 hypothetical protein [Clostridium tagluense]MCB2322768.1 hypothetical protein [Clostridium tagluense]MCB2327816.1 hypothetical protein [Clostridium tagluense]